MASSDGAGALTSVENAAHLRGIHVAIALPCHLLGPFGPCIGIVAIAVEQARATADLEAVYREDGARLWRALSG